jgi:prepilin peptidase CpaA
LIIAKYISLFSLVLLALISDARTYKIKNAIILPFFLFGLVINLYSNGISGAVTSLLAAALPVLLLMILFIMRMLGAGDIKLFSAIGAITGIRFVLYSVAFSFISGGIIALIIMAIRKNGRKRLHHLLEYIKLCFATLSIQPYTDFQNKEDDARFHFSFAIAVGTVVTVLSIKPFQSV